MITIKVIINNKTWVNNSLEGNLSEFAELAKDYLPKRIKPENFIWFSKGVFGYLMVNDDTIEIIHKKGEIVTILTFYEKK